MMQSTGFNAKGEKRFFGVLAIDRKEDKTYGQVTEACRPDENPCHEDAALPVLNRNIGIRSED